MTQNMVMGYPLKRSSRKTCEIKVKANGEVTVYAPIRMPMQIIEQFVRDKGDWIARTQDKFSTIKEQKKQVQPFSREEIYYLVQDAKRLIPPKVKHYAEIMGVRYNRITIKSQHTRWGSCSSKKNLNFNCLLMLVPDEVVDYVIVHELCHLKEMNHSEKFWAEVKRVLPDYKLSYSWLRKHGGELIAKLPRE